MYEQTLLSMALLLLFAKLIGEVFERLGVASLVGEIAAGVLLGPVLGWVALGDFLKGFLIFGIAFVLFRSGLEVKFENIKKYIYKASFLAAAGGIISFFLGFFVGMFFFGNVLVSVAIGTVMISTSNGALFLLLMRTGEFDSKIGRIIVAITIADDIVGILSLSFFNMFVTQKIAVSQMFFVFLVSIGLYIFVLEFGSKTIGKFLDRINTFGSEHVLFTIPIAIAFFLAYVTNNLGLSVATGAFLAGMAMANSQFAEPIIMEKVNVASRGFIVPVYYASIGALVVLTGLNYPLIIAIIITALAGKFIGCGLFSWFTGASRDEITLTGISMMPRGDENIATLQIVLLLGVITTVIYTSLVFAIVVTTITAPILAKVAYKKR